MWIVSLTLFEKAFDKIDIGNIVTCSDDVLIYSNECMCMSYIE